MRDDFWLAVSRFLKALEVPLVEGQNVPSSTSSPDHARSARGAGRAFGRCWKGAGIIPGENEFLHRVVNGLAEDGKSCTAQGSSAEMVKGKPWTPATLKELGGTAGVGVAFLDETFTASTAPPQHRVHQDAAQAVLKALLPETGTAIKGHACSTDPAASRHGRPADFDDLIRILDRELRLVTPTIPPDWKIKADRRDRGQKWYQLIRRLPCSYRYTGLASRASRRTTGAVGRIAARGPGCDLSRKETRQLPSLFQWLRIPVADAVEPPPGLLVEPQDGGEGRGAASSTATVALLLALAAWTINYARNDLKADALYGQLLDANTTDVPRIVRE